MMSHDANMEVFYAWKEGRNLRPVRDTLREYLHHVKKLLLLQNDDPDPPPDLPTLLPHLDKPNTVVTVLSALWNSLLSEIPTPFNESECVCWDPRALQDWKDANANDPDFHSYIHPLGPNSYVRLQLVKHRLSKKERVAMGGSPKTYDHQKESLHRLICFLFFGLPPAEQGLNVALHACNMPSCLNPYHIHWGSQEENKHWNASLDVRVRVLARRRAYLGRPLVQNWGAEEQAIEEEAWWLIWMMSWQ